MLQAVKQSQTPHACRLNLSNMKCCYYSGKTQEGLQSPYYIPQHNDISTVQGCKQGKEKRKEDFRDLFSNHLTVTAIHYIGIQQQDHLICKVIVHGTVLDKSCIKSPGAYLFQTHLGGGGGGEGSLIERESLFERGRFQDLI